MFGMKLRLPCEKRTAKVDPCQSHFRSEIRHALPDAVGGAVIISRVGDSKIGCLRVCLFRGQLWNKNYRVSSAFCNGSGSGRPRGAFRICEKYAFRWKDSLLAGENFYCLGGESIA